MRVAAENSFARVLNPHGGEAYNASAYTTDQKLEMDPELFLQTLTFVFYC